MEKKEAHNSTKRPIILRLIREGKPEGECSMSLFFASIRENLRRRQLILSSYMRKNKNLCTRYKAKLLE